MKIKHYPGKAVINDPAWLEMDISNQTRGRLYEANWLDTQKNLSSNSSASNSWDKYSTVSSKLGQYQNILQELKKENEDLYAVPNKLNKVKKEGSVRLKYHSDKCLSRINSKTKKDFDEEMIKYYLPSQTKIQRERSFKQIDENKPVKRERSFKKIEEPKPVPKPRQNKEQKFADVIDDLRKEIKKSVRFNEKSTEITDGKKSNCDNEDDSTDDEVTKERVNEWVVDQNKYLSDSSYVTEEPHKNLDRNDSGYYEHTKKVRQRLPPRNIYPSSDDESETSRVSNDAFNVYKSGVTKQHVVVTQPRRTEQVNRRADGDFSIPRPKLIVPVHTYAVRRRRTGNLQKQSVSESNYDSDFTEREQQHDKKGNVFFLFYCLRFVAESFFKSRRVKRSVPGTL